MSYIGTPGNSGSVVIATATGGQYQGNLASTAPAAGFIGEQIRATLALGSATALSTDVTENVVSISLTAGIWDVSAVCSFTGAAVSTGSCASVVTTTGTNGTSGDNRADSAASSTAAANNSIIIPAYRLSLASTTITYLTALSGFSGSQSVFGRISATRVG